MLDAVRHWADAVVEERVKTSLLSTQISRTRGKTPRRRCTREVLACTYLILGRDAGQRSFDIRRQTSDSHSAGRPSGFAPGGASRRDARSVFLEDSGTPRDDGRSHDIDLDSCGG